jgi:hypothetical protein
LSCLLALTPFPRGENKCASTSTNEEDEEVLSSSEEVDWWRLPLLEAVLVQAFASGEKIVILYFLDELPTLWR